MSHVIGTCPCCGAESANFHDERVTYGQGDFPTEWSIRCECGLRTKGFPTGWEGTELQCKEKALAVWNRRTA